MFLQTKLYASYVRYWHFVQYVAHLVDITCMWVEVDVGKGDADCCQASDHRPRLRFDIWKTLQDFFPAGWRNQVTYAENLFSVQT